MNSLSRAALAALVNHHFDFIMLSNQATDFVIGSNGRARLSQRKVSELLKVSQPAISKLIKNDNLNLSETSEHLARYGFDGDNLAALVEYYAFDSKQASPETVEQCRKIYRQAAAKSFQDFIDTLAGISIPDAPKVLLMLPEQRLQIAVESIKFFGIDVENPRVKQGYQDYVNNLLLHQPRLPPSSDQWLGAVERAEELGHGRIGADLSLRTRLGQHVSKYGLERRQEKRMCNGTQQKIWIYQVCDRLDEAINSFFDLHLL